MGCGSSFPEKPVGSVIPEDETDGFSEQHEPKDVDIRAWKASPGESNPRNTKEDSQTENLNDVKPGLQSGTNHKVSEEAKIIASPQEPEVTQQEPAAKMDATAVLAYNEECLQLAQQIVSRNPALESGFEDINAFVKALEDDPEMKRNGELIKGLTKKVVLRSYVNKDETHRRVLAEYMSYIRAAEVIFKSYVMYLKQKGLEFLTEVIANESLSQSDYKFVRELRTIFWNYTDASWQFSERVCNCGILKYFVGDLQAVLDEAGDPSKVSPNDKFFRAARGVLHNVSNNPVNRQTIRELGTVPVALAYLKGGSPVIKMTILLLLANIIDEEDNKVLIADSTVFTVILRMIEFAWSKPRHRCDGFSVAELTVGLTGLAKNDENKKILTQKGAIPVLMTILKDGSDQERENAARCVWELAFDKDNQKTFRANDDLMAILEDLKTSSNRKLSKVAEGALWAINMEKKEEEEQAKMRKSDQDTNGKPLKGHVMISYQWGDQKMLIKVKEFLKSQNFNVWMDIDNMEGSTLQAMAEAVQNAAVVLVCMSERYKESQNCRSEAEYAFDLRKPIIPLLMQRSYKPDGWLGLLKGAKLFFDFSGKYPFDNKAMELVKELGNRGKGILSQDTVDAGPAAVVKSMPADANRGSGGVVNWSHKDVHNWLSKLGLEKQASLKSLTGKQLVFLRKLSYKAPEFFYGYIKTDLHLTNLEDLMNFSEGVENL